MDISFQEIEKACKKQYRLNMKKMQKSFSVASMLNRVLKEYLLEVKDNGKVLVMKPDWRLFIKINLRE